MSRTVNINSINPITFEYQTYSVEDSSLIFNITIDATFNPTLDIVEYFIYDLNGQIVYSNVTGYPGYTINDKNVVISEQKVLIDQLKSNIETKDITINALQKQVNEYKIREYMYDEELVNLGKQIDLKNKIIRKQKSKMIIGGSVGGVAVIGLLLSIILVK